jgi:mono/diheme cytochrome c family protein
MKRFSIHRLFLVSFLFLAACASSSTTEEPNRATGTPIPIYQFNIPTEPPQLETVAALTAVGEGNVSELDPERVSRGRDRYVALECGACHGENGEGTDANTSLIGLTLSEGAFVSLMRSGGALGADHQYSTNRLSDSGGKNLYQYLLSLNEN